MIWLLLVIPGIAQDTTPESPQLTRPDGPSSRAEERKLEAESSNIDVMRPLPEFTAPAVQPAAPQPVYVLNQGITEKHMEQIILILDRHANASDDLNSINLQLLEETKKQNKFYRTVMGVSLGIFVVSTAISVGVTASAY